MIGKSGMFWQTLLADLALILFIVSASTLDATEQERAPPAPLHQPGDPSQALAIWRAGPQAPPLREWLRSVQADSRAAILIIAEYDSPAGRDEAWSSARELAQQAEAAGRTARVTLQSGTGGNISASLLYDGALGEIGPDIAKPAAN